MDQKEKALQELKQLINQAQQLLDRAHAKLTEIEGNTQNVPPQQQPQPPRPVSPTQHIIQERIGSSTRMRSPQTVPSQAPATRPEKMLVGIEKLDDLLGAGIRTSSNVLLVGPPYSGKDILAWNFIATSLRDQIPVMIITTDKSINDIKMEISRIYPEVENAETAGLLRFIDVYSRSIQTQTQSQYAVTIDNLINVSSLMKATDSIASQFLSTKPYYRLVFTSLTSYLNELDEKIYIKFIQQFAQKRKSEYCTSLYLLEAGLFDKKVVDAITYLMDGSITFKSEGSKIYLRVEGLGTVRSRDWVEVFLHETTFELGAFTLEKIR